jgi:acid phosphatase
MISTGGMLTAPATKGQVTVKAVDAQDSTRFGTAVVTVQITIPASKHVVMVMEENRSFSDVVKNTAEWPNLNALIAAGALPTNYYANAHFSIGNYFMLTTGELVTTDDNDTSVRDIDNIARRMLAAGVSFRVYAEGITRGYVGGNTGNYVIRHNPFAMLSDVANSATVANEVLWPFSQFAIDEASHSLPQFSFIVPDISDDSHSAAPVRADTWLQQNVVTLLNGDPAFQSGGDGVLIVDFDEGEVTDIAHGGGQIAPVLWGPTVTPGYVQTSNTLYQHQSMLATVMVMLNLPNPPGEALTAPTMDEFFKH